MRRSAPRRIPTPAPRASRPTEDVDELVGRTVTINRPRQELYDFWRDFRNLPLFMENIESVTILDGNRSHWKVRGPAKSEFEWDSVITEDIPGEADRLELGGGREREERGPGRVPRLVE